MRLIDADEIPYHKQLEAQGNGQYEDVEVAYKSEIDAVPTVNLSKSIGLERHGKWIESNPKKSKSCRLVECSECGNIYIVNTNIPLKVWARGNKTFCGNCGAKMQEEE